jgi:hypothetical protein
LSRLPKIQGGLGLIGDPDEVIEKILFQHEIFHHQCFLVNMATMP